MTLDEQKNHQNKDTIEDDPFADIMKKLKSESTGTSKTESCKNDLELKSENFTLNETKNSTLNQEKEFNLMDEVPPESFEKIEKEFEEFDSKNLKFKEDLLSVKTESSEIENIEHKSLETDQETQLVNENENEKNSEIDNENEINNDKYKYNGISNGTSNESNYFDMKESGYIIKNNSEPQEIFDISKPVESSSVSDFDFKLNVTNETEKESTVQSSLSDNTLSSASSSPNSNSIPRTGGFRASIFKHGLSALERIGKSTADVVVSTRNKLNDTSTLIQSSSPYANQKQTANVITPNFNDRNSTFYDIFKLYGGYSKLQV